MIARLTILGLLQLAFSLMVSTRAQTSGGSIDVTPYQPPPPIQIGPVITLQPRHTSALLGGKATFTVEGSSPSGSLNFQWFHNSILIPGATNDLLTITNVTTQDLGTYTVQLTENSMFPLLSRPAVLLLANLADLSISPAVHITASAEAGKFLQLEFSNDLQTWSDDGSPLEAVSPHQTFTRVASEGSPGFYRVKVTDVFPGGPGNLDSRALYFPIGRSCLAPRSVHSRDKPIHPHHSQFFHSFGAGPLLLAREQHQCFHRPFNYRSGPAHFLRHLQS